MVPGPTRVLNAKGASIASAVFAGLTSDRRREHVSRSVTLGRIYVHVVRARKKHEQWALWTWKSQFNSSSYNTQHNWTSYRRCAPCTGRLLIAASSSVPVVSRHLRGTCQLIGAISRSNVKVNTSQLARDMQDESPTNVTWRDNVHSYEVKGQRSKLSDTVQLTIYTGPTAAVVVYSSSAHT